jgi:hypothetical protein
MGTHGSREPGRGSFFDAREGAEAISGRRRLRRADELRRVKRPRRSGKGSHAQAAAAGGPRERAGPGTGVNSPLCLR